MNRTRPSSSRRRCSIRPARLAGRPQRPARAWSVAIGFLAPALLLWPVVQAAPRYVAIAPAQFRSVMPPDGRDALARVGAFEMRATPVTQGEYLTFLRAQPSWRRDAVAAVFAESGYLSHWREALDPGDTVSADQPVTRVSWFAARAFCQSEGARLPIWHEWEWVAAADEAQADARADPRWRARILSWYGRPAGAPLPAVGLGAANLYGVRDLHGLVWEWVEDFNGVMISADSREQGDPDLLKFCGAGAITLKVRDDYAMLMRLALLSSLQASYASPSLGFRCVRDSR